MYCRTSRTGRTRGFTLIELLVVIAIIALLVSILMPSLQVAKEMAKDVVCRSNQKNICYAIMLYAEDYDEFYPYTSAPYYGYFIPPLSWAEKIGRIEDTYELLPYPYRYTDEQNPEDKDRPRDGKRICLQGYIDFKYNDFREGHFKCPAATERVEPKSLSGRWGCQFSINQGLSPLYRDEHRDGFDPPAPPRKLSEVRTGCVLTGDCHLGFTGTGLQPSWGFSVGSNGDLRTYPGDRGQVPERSGPWTHQPFGQAYMRQFPIDFYGHPGDRANFLYTDGHVGSVGEIDVTEWNIR